MLDDKKYNRGSSVTPNLGLSNEMFNKNAGKRSIVLSNQNSQSEVEGTYDI